MCMNVSTFEYLCTLPSFLQRQDTNKRLAVPVQVKIIVPILRLATCNFMQSISDLFMIGLSIGQLVVSQFSAVIKFCLFKKFIRWPSSTVMDKFAHNFYNLHKKPHVVGAVDGSHKPIVAPRLHAAHYYNQKGFYSILL